MSQHNTKPENNCNKNFKKLAYSLKEAAKRLGVSDRHLRKFVQTGELVSFQLGRSRRISERALADFIRTREAQAVTGQRGEAK